MMLRRSRAAAKTGGAAGVAAGSEPRNGDPATRHFVTVLIVIATALVALLIWPFATAFFAAAVFAAGLYPLQRRLTKAVGQRPHLAAAVLTLATLAVVVVPVVLASISVVDEAAHWRDWIETTAREEGLPGLLEPVPEPLRPPTRALLRLLPPSVLALSPEGAAVIAPETPLPTVAAPPADPDAPPDPAPAGLTDVIAGVAHGLIMLGILIVALFFLLAEGEALIAYLLDLFPLANRTSRAMLRSFREISVAVMLSTFVTALIQAAAACIGYLIAGVPSLSLLTFVTFLMAFVPVFGATGVAVTSGIVMWVSGHVGAGIFLTTWGLLAVGLIDNVVKPLIVGGRTALGGGVVFFSMICGLAVFGPAGLVAGPLIVAFFMSVARIASAQTGQPAA